MKDGKSLITFVILALAAFLAVYLSAHVLDGLDEPYRTTQVYSYTANDSVLAEGLVVREALVLSAPSGILEVTRTEGEKVGKGQQIALVYQNSQAQSNQAQIEQLELDIALLEEAIAQSGDLESAARLDEDILQAVVELRASYAQEDYSRMQEQVIAVKSSVLKRGYTYGEGLSAADLSLRMRQLKDELSVLAQQSARATTRITAPVPGVFSNLVDGYEAQLTPEYMRQLTPASLQELMNSSAGEDVSSLGKLITSDTWYFAALLPQESAARLREGDRATLRFSGELNRDVSMAVEQLGPTENGKTLAIFSSNRYLAYTTLLRAQTAELIFESWSGLRIPKEALHLADAEQEDPETGELTPVHRLGVYALVNGRAEFHELSIVMEGSDYYVVQPVGAGNKVLRIGDVVIVEGSGLQDGLLLEH